MLKVVTFTTALFSGTIMVLRNAIQVLLQTTCTNHVMGLSLRDPLTSST